MNKLIYIRVIIFFIIITISNSVFLSNVYSENSDTENENNKQNDSWCDIHFQQTFVNQYHPAFEADYTGRNSLLNNEENCLSLTTTLFMNFKLWKNTKIYFNPEVSGGSGFSKVQGIAGFPNNEIVRVGNVAPTAYLAKIYLEHEFKLNNQDKINGNKESVSDASSVILRIGKFSSLDYFDNNKYSHDGRSQFMNWGLVSNGSWDYSADTRGYTLGLMTEYINPVLSARFMLSMVPNMPNGPDFDENVSNNHSIVVELEKPYTIFGKSGKARLLVFINSEKSGIYSEAISKNDLNIDSSGLRKDGTSKYGICLNFEQDINENIGVFLRAGINDGKTESWMFTEIDQSLSGGTLIDGKFWKRQNDKIGLAFSFNGLSEEHKEFLKKGGYGFIIGDGKLHYGIETNLEVFYKIYLTNFIQVSCFYQFVNNPAYNKDRGQVNIYSIRTHIEF